MDQQEFATRAEAIKARLYRTAYLYLGSEADALDAVSEATAVRCKDSSTCGSRSCLKHGLPVS